MSKYKKNDFEKAQNSIDEAIIVISKIRNKETEKENFKSAFVIDLEEVLSDLERAINGIDYISGNDY